MIHQLGIWTCTAQKFWAVHVQISSWWIYVHVPLVKPRQPGNGHAKSTLSVWYKCGSQLHQHVWKVPWLVRKPWVWLNLFLKIQCVIDCLPRLFHFFCFVLFCFVFAFFNEQPGYKANDTLAEVLALVGNLSSCDHASYQQCACALVSMCMFYKLYSVHFFQHIQYYHNW